jgi:formylglycine-generating enzyme required for sulfatase activity
MLAVGAWWLAGCGEQDLYKPPVSPYEIVGTLPLPSEPQDVALLGQRAYLAGGEAGLLVVDVSDPANPQLLTMLDTKKFAESIRVATVPYAQGFMDVAFVVEGTEGITTYNVTNPDSAYSFEQGTTAVDGNGLFIEIPEDPTEPFIVYLAENWKGLRIFESDPNIPGLLRYNGVFSYTRGYAKAVAVKEGFAYVADNEMGVAVLDVRQRVLGLVRVVSATDTEGKAQGIDVAGSYAYVADGKAGLAVLEIHEGDPPIPVGRLELPGDSRDIVVREGVAFIAAEDGGVHIVDVSDPAHPVLLGTNVTSYAVGVDVGEEGLVAVADRYDGLVLLAGPHRFPDHTPPASVGDLAATPEDSTSVRLTWTAPGDDLYRGQAASYDIRYALAPIEEATWPSATAVEGEPDPLPAGNPQSFVVTGLSPETHYYFALKTLDEAGNVSHLSNVTEATTPRGNVPPALTDLSVTPEVGEPGTTFTFRVTYTDGDGDLPSTAEVLIRGEAHPMELESGEVETGAVYAYSTTLDRGSYDYAFRFDDGHGHLVVTRIVQGPWVGTIFQMGSPPDEPGRDTDETLHTVVLTRNFWISDHEVTQEEYEAVMGTNPSRIKDPQRPVENVTWFDAIAYCNARSLQEGLEPAYEIDGETVTWNPDADGYRLPTEAEWEYACRAGTQTAFSGGPITEEYCGLDPVLDALGWYCGNAEDTTHPVKQKQPNAMGLYDMHGNVWEWCWDRYTEDLGAEVAVDPQGPTTGAQRVIRGGSWYYYARECRSASRAPYWPNSGDDIVGFRVARTLP